MDSTFINFKNFGSNPMITALPRDPRPDITTALHEGGIDPKPTPPELSSTYALGEEGGEVTTMAVGEEGGGGFTTAMGEGGELTTAALGEEGGIPCFPPFPPGGCFPPPPFFPPLPPPDKTSKKTADYVAFQQEADKSGNADGKLTRKEARKQVSEYQEQLEELRNRQTFAYDPALEKQIADLEKKLTVGQRMLRYFDKFASGSASLSSKWDDPSTVSVRDIKILSRKDGNASDVSDKDLGIRRKPPFPPPFFPTDVVSSGPLPPAREWTVEEMENAKPA